MLSVTEARRLSNTYFFFAETFFLEFRHMPRKLLLVVLAKQDTVMVKHIATDADAHVCRSNIIIAVDLSVIVTRKDSNRKSAHNAEHSLVGMTKDDVVDKARVMWQTRCHGRGRQNRRACEP